MTINHNRAEVYKAKEKGVERGRPKKKKKKKKEVLQGNKKHAKSVQKDGLKTKYQRKGLR